MTGLSTRLVKVAADAVSQEELRSLGGHAPTGGHGYFAPGIVAAVALLRELDGEHRTIDFAGLAAEISIASRYKACGECGEVWPTEDAFLAACAKQATETNACPPEWGGSRDLTAQDIARGGVCPVCPHDL